MAYIFNKLPYRKMKNFHHVSIREKRKNKIYTNKHCYRWFTNKTGAVVNRWFKENM